MPFIKIRLPYNLLCHNHRDDSQVAAYFGGLYIVKMLVSELSKRTGISVHTIRYYEKFGLIKGKHKEDIESNNYLHYDEETIAKLELIRNAKAIGFTLKELKRLIDAWYNKKISRLDKIKILDEKILSVDVKIKQLKEMKKLIAQFKKVVSDDDCS